MARQTRATSTASPPPLHAVPMSDSLRDLAARGTPRLVAKGRLLIQEGDVGNTLFIILSGRLRAFSRSTHSDREVTYGEYLPGEYIGELSLDGGPRSADVQALVSSWVVAVNRATLEQHIAEQPAFAFELLAKVIRRTRAATLSLRAVALNDVYGRVAWLLNERAVAQADGSRLCGPLTHLDMASLLGCTRPMVSRVMKELERGGYVRREGDLTRLLRPLPARF
jgi:CRP/FNR family transcriptional regulator, cyclic AMP receptor protein